ncbi:hypothetical protein EMPS_10459 [Entomortierella parvispora]|uniref:Uncharacterized protein n=1 Tax=Entomortierella parvispora TaxID=205924 RepID=A0A9P3M1J9_9FUNG|nr:hypothetical protein EMPS_10459 [Entomortierella parvispora]
MYRARKNRNVPGMDSLAHHHGMFKEEDRSSQVAKSSRSWFPRSGQNNYDKKRGYGAYDHDLELNMVAHPDPFAGFESSVLPEDHEPPSANATDATAGRLRAASNPSKTAVLAFSSNTGSSALSPSPISPITAASAVNANVDIAPTRPPAASAAYAYGSKIMPAPLPAVLTCPRQGHHGSQNSISLADKKQRTKMIQDLILNGNGQ